MGLGKKRKGISTERRVMEQHCIVSLAGKPRCTQKQFAQKYARGGEWAAIYKTHLRNRSQCCSRPQKRGEWLIDSSSRSEPSFLGSLHGEKRDLCLRVRRKLAARIRQRWVTPLLDQLQRPWQIEVHDHRTCSKSAKGADKLKMCRKVADTTVSHLLASKQGSIGRRNRLEGMAMRQWRQKHSAQTLANSSLRVTPPPILVGTAHRGQFCAQPQLFNGNRGPA